jgi:uncharacterized protein YkwD
MSISNLTVKIVVFVCMVVLSSYCFGSPDADERAVVDKLNAARAAVGLCPLEIDTACVEGCRRWSHNLRTSKPRVVRGFFSYSVTRIWHASAKERNGYAECVAYNPSVHKDAFQQWRNSPPHWNVMMKRRINRIGVGRSGGYWTLRVYYRD